MVDENLWRAQLLADQAFDMLMWNENGDGTTYTPRPITDPQQERVEVLTALSQSYATLAVATGEGRIMNSNSNSDSDEREI